MNTYYILLISFVLIVSISVVCIFCLRTKKHHKNIYLAQQNKELEIENKTLIKHLDSSDLPQESVLEQNKLLKKKLLDTINIENKILMNEYKIFKNKSKLQYNQYKLNQTKDISPIMFKHLTKSNVCICMHGTVDMYPHYSKSLYINYEYSKYHNYNFHVVYDTYESENYIVDVLQTIPSCSYILYIDHDSYIFNFNQTVEKWIQYMGTSHRLLSLDCSGNQTKTPFLLNNNAKNTHVSIVEYGEFLVSYDKCKKNDLYNHSFIRKYPNKNKLKYFKTFKNTIKSSNKLKTLQQTLKINAIQKVQKNPMICMNYLNDIPVYYINLERANERREWMESQSRDLGIHINRLEAVDGKTFSNIKKGSYTFKDGDILYYKALGTTTENRYEIACCLSHVHAIQTAYENGDTMALIMEDDVLLYTIPMWGASIQEMINDIKDWGLINLCGLNFSKKEMGVTTDILWGCQAYLINRRGMEIIMSYVHENTIILNKSDEISNVYKKENSSSVENKILADTWMYANIKLYNLLYNIRPIILPYNSETMNSYIHDGHTQVHQNTTRTFIQDFIPDT